jgi:hypothetical protein
MGFCTPAVGQCNTAVTTGGHGRKCYHLSGERRYPRTLSPDSGATFLQQEGRFGDDRRGGLLSLGDLGDFEGIRYGRADRRHGRACSFSDCGCDTLSESDAIIVVEV